MTDKNDKSQSSDPDDQPNFKLDSNLEIGNDDDTRELQKSGYVSDDNPDVEILDSSDSEPVKSYVSESQKTVISKQSPLRQSRPKRDSEAVGEQLEGSRLEHFELEEFVGGGGMGAVFRATDTKLGRTVAVKVLSQHQQAADALRRFKNEAQSAARLDHSNIARVYYVGEDRGWHFIVFEYIHGVNIRDLIEHRGPLPLDEALSYMIQIADALQHAASRDVVHRDIKPSNILITTNGSAKLVDMGLARFEHLEPDNSDMTASGVTLGTFDYISPEQARDPRSTDVRSDLYSLGCTFYFMLTGMPPYPQGTVLQKLLSHSSEPPPDPRAYREDIDDQSLTLMHKLLAKRPEDRQQTPAILIHELLDLGDRLGIPLSTTTQLHLQHRASRGLTIKTHFPWLVSAICLLATVLLVQLLSKQTEPVVIARPVFLRPSYVPPAESVEPSVQQENDSIRNSSMETTESSPSVDEPNEIELTDTEPVDAGGVIYVGPSTAQLPTSILRVESLERAFLLAAGSPKYNVIEIGGSGVVPIPAISLSLEAADSNQLTIRAAQDAQPTVLVIADEEDTESITPALFELTNGSLTFERLSIRFQLPSVFRQSWSLFRFYDVRQVRFHNCVLEVAAGDPTVDESSHINVALFDYGSLLIDDPENGESGQESVNVNMRESNIELLRTIVRGDCSLLRCSNDNSVALNWTDGWMATNQWLLDCQCSDRDAKGAIRVDTSHVTLFSGEGMIRLAGNAQKRFPPTISFNVNRSILLHPKAVPTILVDGVTFLQDIAYRPQVSMTDSFYDLSGSVLAVRHLDSPELPEIYLFSDLESNESADSVSSWFRISAVSNIRELTWQIPREDFVFDEPSFATTSDFLIEGIDESDPSNVPGFRSATLPSIP
ncbi:MAG: serine/threonine protein kinase [Pirellulales bacterium]|nr:serine/threonine protein kinase [Pirellulales bacterium]